MSGAQFNIQATGFSHSADIKPVQRNGGPVEWHRAKCPAPVGKCTGCASPPRKGA